MKLLVPVSVLLMAFLAMPLVKAVTACTTGYCDSVSGGCCFLYVSLISTALLCQISRTFSHTPIGLAVAEQPVGALCTVYSVAVYLWCEVVPYSKR